jgi:hypothetical protein
MTKKSAHPIPVWNFGNTTLRNPNRIARGLRLFADEFQGKVYGALEEAKFAARLAEEGIVETSGKNADWLGRKWRSAFVKLGFATDKEARIQGKRVPAKLFPNKLPDLKLHGFPYELTPVGGRLLDANLAASSAAIEDVYLRQLVMLELPSPIEPTFSNGNMKPFIVLLHVLDLLRSQHLHGLTKVEIGAFLQVFHNHDSNLAARIVYEIQGYRRKRNLLSGEVARRNFDQQTIEKSSAQTRVKPDTLRDYADTTARYSILTGVVMWEGTRLVLRENRIPLIEAILAEPLSFMGESDPWRYLREFYTGKRLPLDDSVFALREIETLSHELTKLGQPVPPGTAFISASTPIQELSSLRYQIADRLTIAREEAFASMQCQAEALKEIDTYLDALGTSAGVKALDILDPPAFFEWAVWRAFLAIDKIVGPISDTRRFPIDQDLRPRDVAPGNGADMIFKFDDFVLVVEVTLLSTSRQEAAEGEPVRRHVATVSSTTEKPSFGLFIAPKIDPNTLFTFSSGLWYREAELVHVDIVPLTLIQFRNIVRHFQIKPFPPQQLRSLLEACLAARTNDPAKWQGSIAEETDKWLNARD